jgi:hypothetical protein
VTRLLLLEASIRERLCGRISACYLEERDDCSYEALVDVTILLCSRSAGTLIGFAIKVNLKAEADVDTGGSPTILPGCAAA